jgi:hypothetical protein
MDLGDDRFVLGNIPTVKRPEVNWASALLAKPPSPRRYWMAKAPAKARAKAAKKASARKKVAAKTAKPVGTPRLN